MVVEKIHLIKVIFIIGESRISRREVRRQPQRWTANRLFWVLFPQNCMKLGIKLDQVAALVPNYTLQIRQRKSAN